MPDDLRFGFDSRIQRMGAVFVALLLAIPIMLIGSIGMITWQATWFVIQVPFMFVKSLLISTGQMFLNIGWFVNRLVSENL